MARQDDYKLVSTHSGYVVVFPAGVLEAPGNRAQDLVSFQMAQAVVYLLEAVQVADQHGERGIYAFRAGQLAIEVQEQRARIGQVGEGVRGGTRFRLPVLESILD